LIDHPVEPLVQPIAVCVPTTMSLAVLSRPHLQHPAMREQAQALHAHMHACRRLRGRWFDAAAWAERAHVRVAPRFVTTVALACGLLALTFGWL
jgi:hypothetical protein